MSSLEQYLFKNIKVTDIYGETYIGYVDLYESKYDSGYNEPSIGIISDKKAMSGIELKESEIKSIKIID